jgi:hypothetical protein
MFLAAEGSPCFSRQRDHHVWYLPKPSASCLEYTKWNLFIKQLCLFLMPLKNCKAMFREWGVFSHSLWFFGHMKPYWLFLHGVILGRHHTIPLVICCMILWASQGMLVILTSGQELMTYFYFLSVTSRSKRWSTCIMSIFHCYNL